MKLSLMFTNVSHLYSHQERDWESKMAQQIKAPAIKLDNVSSVSRANRVEEQNHSLLLYSGFCLHSVGTQARMPERTCNHSPPRHACVQVHAQINENF